MIPPTALRDLAGPKVFARGEAYFSEGRVRLLSVDERRVLASVIGSETYRAELRWHGPRWSGVCDCRAYEDASFCKHLVAVGLAAGATAGTCGCGTRPSARSPLGWPRSRFGLKRAQQERFHVLRRRFGPPDLWPQDKRRVADQIGLQSHPVQVVPEVLGNAAGKGLAGGPKMTLTMRADASKISIILRAEENIGPKIDAVAAALQAAPRQRQGRQIDTFGDGHQQIDVLRDRLRGGHRADKRDTADARASYCGPYKGQSVGEQNRPGLADRRLRCVVE